MQMRHAATRLFLVCAVAFCGFASPGRTEDLVITPEVAKVAVKLMETTRTNLVAEFDAPAGEFKADGDPETIEIVMLKSKKLGASHVSEDGEVIFIAPRTKDSVQSDLITQAFYIRALNKMKAEGAQPQ